MGSLMSVLTQRADSTEYTVPHEHSGIQNWLTYVLSSGALLIGIIATIAYLTVALGFQRGPFLGLFLNRDAEVMSYQSFADAEVWPGLEIGIQSEDTIAAVESQALDDDTPTETLAEILADYEPGDRILVEIEREGVRSGIPGAERCDVEANRTTCLAYLELGQLSTVDFVGYFVIGFLSGLVALGISAWVLVRRPNTRPARFFVGLGAALAAFSMGYFNLLTTHDSVLVLLWIFAGCMFGGSMISFSMVFPTNMSIVEQIPVSRYGPLVVGILLTALVYGLYDNGNNAILQVPAIFIGISGLVMMGVMVWRRQYTSSPIFREQASYVLLGAFFGITPLVAWTIYQIVGQDTSDFPAWVTPSVQIISLLFLFSVAYALLQERLLETDRLFPMVVVYNLLGLALVLSYAAVVTGLSAIGVQSIDSDNPVLIAVIVLIVAFGFLPIRTRLHERIDTIMFRRRRHYQQRIESLMNNLTNAINVSDVYKVMHQELDEALAPSDIILFVRDTETQVFRAHVPAGQVVTDINIAFNSGLAQYLRYEASVLYLEEGRPLPPGVIANRAQLAVLNTPIIVRLLGQRQLNGFIAIGRSRSGLGFTYDDLQFVERIADQVALALERTQIVEDLESRFRIQDVLSQVSRALSYAIDLDTLMELLYAQTSRVIEADIFAISIVEESFNQLYYAFFVEGEERLEHLEMRRWEMGNDLVSEVARTQQVIRVDDYVAASLQRDPNSRLVNSNVKAWIAAPLSTDTAAGTLGVMAVGTTDPTVRYSDDQVQLFLDIASLAASAINRTQLLEATQARTQQLEVLNQISSQLSSEISDVDRLLDLITRSAMNILKCQAGSLLMRDQETDELVFRVALGPGAQSLIGQRIDKTKPSLANEALERAESVIVNDTASDARWHGEVLQMDDGYEEDATLDTFQSRAILTTPLLTQGEAIGVLQIINKEDGSPFTNEDATMLTTFATQAAVAIQNARLYALQDERLIQRVSELEGLAAIDQSLNQSLELQMVVEITLNWAIRQSGAKAGALAMINTDNTDVMYLIACKGYPEGARFAADAVGNEFSTSKGIWGRVIRTGTPAFARGLKRDPERNIPGDPDYVETYPNAVVQIVVPIISASDVIGILIVESDVETDLTLLDMEFLTRLSDHASPAIINAQLFEELRHQQEARADFVRFIAHELKNPMTSMKGYTDLLMRGVVGPLNEQQSTFLETIFNNVNRLEALVNDLRDVEAQDAGQLSLAMGSVEFPKVVREVLRAIEQDFERKEQEIEVTVDDNLPMVWADHQRLVQIMTNFMTNANKYTPESGTVKLVAEPATNIWDTEGVRRVLHVQISDTGIGMSEEELDRLFKEKYFRTDRAKDTDEPGTGLGMVLTHGLILQHGGQIWVESEVNVGSTFHFTLPLADEVMREAT